MRQTGDSTNPHPSLCRAARWVRVALLAAAASVLLSGCGLFAFATVMAEAAKKIPAAYELPDKVTLVMVDDPSNLLGNPMLQASMGDRVGYFLMENEVVTAGMIDQRELVRLAREMGNDYGKTPIDQIGARLDAEQVIHVLVELVSMQVAGDMYRPTAVVQVKVIDVVNHQRVFPEPDKLQDSSVAPRGHAVRVEMDYAIKEATGRGDAGRLARTLSDEVARQVALLFYEHRPDPPASGRVGE